MLIGSWRKLCNFTGTQFLLSYKSCFWFRDTVVPGTSRLTCFCSNKFSTTTILSFISPDVLNMNYLCQNCSVHALLKALDLGIHVLAAKWNLFKSNSKTLPASLKRGVIYLNLKSKAHHVLRGKDVMGHLIWALFYFTCESTGTGHRASDFSLHLYSFLHFPLFFLPFKSDHPCSQILTNSGHFWPWF